MGISIEFIIKSMNNIRSKLQSEKNLAWHIIRQCYETAT